jgi:hypothetical protein
MDYKIEVDLAGIGFRQYLSRKALKLLEFLDDRLIEGKKKVVIYERSKYWESREQLENIFELAETFVKNGNNVDRIEKPLKLQKREEKLIDNRIEALKLNKKIKEEIRRKEIKRLEEEKKL